jgi:hypothetical protein
MEKRVSLWVYWSPGQEDRRDALCANAKTALTDLGLPPEISVWPLQKEEDARVFRVYGTPSVKVNNLDAEEDLMMYAKHGLWNRSYMLAGCEIPCPTVASIREAIIDALARQRARSEGRLR